MTLLAATTSPPIHPDDEVELMARVAAGDELAVEELYRRHGRLAWAIAVRCVGDEQLAREIVQDAFVCLWRDARRFDAGRSGIATLLAHVVRARARDRLRREGAGRRGGGASDAPLDAAAHIPSDEQIEEQVLLAERSAAVRDALDELPAQQRVLLELAFLRGYSHSQLSDALGIPVGTVKTRLFRGMARMRELLGPQILPEVNQ